MPRGNITVSTISGEAYELTDRNSPDILDPINSVKDHSFLNKVTPQDKGRMAEHWRQYGSGNITPGNDDQAFEQFRDSIHNGDTLVFLQSSELDAALEDNRPGSLSVDNSEQSQSTDTVRTNSQGSTSSTQKQNTKKRSFSDYQEGQNAEGDGKYGSIPPEHHHRYDRYLENKPNTPLPPEQWYRKAKIAWSNNSKGNTFEKEVREELGAPIGKGSKPVSIDGFVPDLPVDDEYGVTDIKNVEYLSNSDQLRAFHQYAAKNNMPFSIIISPKTQGVSKEVLDNIRKTGGELYEYNPSTQSMATINIGKQGYWRR